MKFKWNGKMHYAWMIMIAGMVLQAACMGILWNTAGVFLQPVSDALGVKRGDLSLYITFITLVAAATMPLAGKWLPTKNINVLLTVMVVICAIGYMLMSTYTQLWQWYITSIIMGFSGAFLWFVPVPMMIRNWFKKKTGLAMGIATACSGVGAAIVSPIQTTMINNPAIGWQKTYLIMGIVSLVVSLPFTLFVFKFKPSDVGMKAYGEAEGDSVKQAASDMNRGMSVSRAAKSGVLALIIILTGVISLPAQMSQHITGYAKWVGLAAVSIGLMSSCNMIGNIVGKLILGAINDKAGIRAAVATGCAVIVISLLMFITYPKEGGIQTVLFIGALLYGFAMSVTTVLPPLIINPMVGGKNFSQIFSYAQTGNMVVSAAGIAMVGKLYDATGAYTSSQIILLVVAVISVPLVFYALSKAKKVGFDPEPGTTGTK